MREILFRGQTRKNGEKVEMATGEKVPGHWVYGGIFPGTGDYSIIYGGETEKDLERHVVYSETVGQYTGLNDKNGNRIFEGDIIKRFLLGAEIIYCVRYDGENAHFIGKALNKNGFTTFDGDGEMFEVICNIHDNPELLKGE